MSIQRLFFRKCILGMLNNGEASPYPTLAKNKIFDSKFDSLDTKEFNQEPIVTVFTDSDSGFNYNNNSREDRIIEVIIQFVIASKNNEGLGFHFTDAKLEATLDILEGQIKCCFTNIANPFSEIYQNLVINMSDFKSIRTASEEGSEKLAARQIQYFAIIKDDELPVKPLSHAENIDNLLKKFEPLNKNGHLTNTLTWLKEQIITPSDTLQDLEGFNISPIKVP